MRQHRRAGLTSSLHVQDAQLQGLQIGDCLGLWGDAEAIGNAADAGRSRIPGLLRGAMAEPGLSSSRCVLVLQHLRSAIHPFSATGGHQGDIGSFMLLCAMHVAVQDCQALLPASAGRTQQSCQSQWTVLWHRLCCGRPEDKEAALPGPAWRRTAGQALGRLGAASLGIVRAVQGRDYHPWGGRCCGLATMAAQTHWHPQSQVRAVCAPLQYCSASMAAVSIWLLRQCFAWNPCATIDVCSVAR